jgi:hypothetical protein
LNLVSGAARRAAYKGQQALTIFDHLLALGTEDDSTGLALHPVEIWELSTAIRYSSAIEEREFISSELATLGDSVREVKDSVIGLNAQGMNAFIWIVVSLCLAAFSYHIRSLTYERLFPNSTNSLVSKKQSPELQLLKQKVEEIRNNRKQI